MITTQGGGGRGKQADRRQYNLIVLCHYSSSRETLGFLTGCPEDAHLPGFQWYIPWNIKDEFGRDWQFNMGKGSSSQPYLGRYCTSDVSKEIRLEKMLGRFTAGSIHLTGKGPSATALRQKDYDSQMRLA